MATTNEIKKSQKIQEGNQSLESVGVAFRPEFKVKTETPSVKAKHTQAQPEKIKSKEKNKDPDKALRKAKKEEGKHHKHHKHGRHDAETVDEEIKAFRNGIRQGQPQQKTSTKGTNAQVGQDEEEDRQVDPLGLGETIPTMMSITDALDLREQMAAQYTQTETNEPDVSLEISTENGFALDMRAASTFASLDDSPQLQLMLSEIVDLSEYFQDKIDRGEISQSESAQIFDFTQLSNRKRKKGLAEEEDIDTLLLVQYLPILYDAINRIISKGVDEAIMTRMESLKGEIAQLVRAASDPSSSLHEIFKNVKDSLEDREMVEWDAA